MCLVSQVSGLVENLNTGIGSDTVNVINVKLCTTALLTELFLVHTTFSDFGHISRSQQCQTV